MLIDFRERGEEEGRQRERNVDVREKHQSVVSCAFPNWGLDVQHRNVTFWFMVTGLIPGALGINDTPTTEPHQSGLNVLTS